MSHRPLRILHLRTVRGTGGGPDKTTLKGCQYLTQMGHVAEAFYILDRGQDTGRLQALADGLGVTMHVAYESSPVSLATVGALGRRLRAGRYDVVHTHDYKSNALAWLLRVAHEYRIVATAHGYNRTTRREAVYYAIERGLFRHVDAIITPTRQMAMFLRRWGVPPGRLHVIANGIEVAGRSRPVRPVGHRPRLLFLGRLSREKDPANLLHAAERLRNGGVDCEVVFAGDGPERPAVEQMIQRLALADRAGLLGFVEDVPPLLASADVLVSPSRTECMPNSLLEAMWAGLPIVATRVGGVEEMIRDEVDGLLCPPGDPERLAGAIGRMLADPAEAAAMAASAFERVRNEFSFDRRMQRVADLYRRVLAEKQRWEV